MNSTEIKTQYVINSKTFDNLQDAENSMSKALRIILHHHLTKLSITKFSQDMATDSTNAPNVMALFLTQQTLITKCKITQMINIPTVQAG